MSTDRLVGTEATAALGGPQTITLIGRTLEERRAERHRAEVAERNAAAHLATAQTWEAAYHAAEGRNAHLRDYNARAHLRLRRMELAAGYCFAVNVALLLAVVLLALTVYRMGGL